MLNNYCVEIEAL